MTSAQGEPPDRERRNARIAEEIFVEAYVLASGGNSEHWPRATRLFQDAAERGHLEAQFNLAYALREGYGVPADPEAASVWLRLAAERGHVNAQVQLGIRLYQLCQAAPVLAEARRWLERAAAADSAVAMVQLGEICERGWGTPRDLDAAVRWYRAAGDHEDALEALRRLGAEAASERPPPAEPPADDEPTWATASLGELTAAAEGGDADAQFELAARLRGDEGTARAAEVVAWCRRAAEASHAVAQVNLAILLETGWGGVEIDQLEARRWWRRATDLGEPTARQIADQGDLARELMDEAFRRCGFYRGKARGSENEAP